MVFHMFHFPLFFHFFLFHLFRALHFSSRMGIPILRDGLSRKSYDAIAVIGLGDKIARLPLRDRRSFAAVQHLSYAHVTLGSWGLLLADVELDVATSRVAAAQVATSGIAVGQLNLKQVIAARFALVARPHPRRARLAIKGDGVV